MTQRVGVPTGGLSGGDVFHSFERLANVIEKNDGIRSFSVLTNNCYDSDQGFTDGQQTHLRITNSLHDINQLSETYIRMTFKARCRFSDLKGFHSKEADDAKKLPFRVFLGWRNSNEMLKQLEVENMNIDTNYLQTECSKEGFAYSVYKPREEKKNRKFVHSLYEDVYNNRPGVCGTYFGCTLSFNKAVTTPAATDYVGCTSDIYATPFTTPSSNNLEISIGANGFDVDNIEIVLPINDILAFQAFEDFPTGLGDIVLKFFVNKDSMVYAICDPVAVDENLKFLNGEAASTDDYSKMRTFTRRFWQVGQQCDCFETNTNKIDGSANSKFALYVDQLTCTKCQCECYGYNITQECKKQLVSLFTPANPYIIPAQQIDIKYFANSAQTAGQYTSDFTYALHNVTDFIVVFPRETTDITTFTNPCIKQVQLRVDGKLYPNQDFENTWDHRFWLAMMNASDLDNFYESLVWLKIKQRSCLHSRPNVTLMVTSSMVLKLMPRMLAFNSDSLAHKLQQHTIKQHLRFGSAVIHIGLLIMRMVLDTGRQVHLLHTCLQKMLLCKI